MVWSGTQDPSSSATAGTIGDVFIRIGTPNIYQKITTSASDINWRLVTTGGITALTGDVSASGPGSASATVNSVGGSSAANVHTAELAANAATSANTASKIVARDGSGNFSAGTITASLTGSASGNLAASANNHGVLVSGSANTATVVAPDASTAKFLKSSGSSADPSWAQVTLTSDVTGTLPVGNGGTGNTAFTTGSIPFSNGTILTQDNTNLFWDSTNHVFMVEGSAGTGGQLFVNKTSSTVTNIPLHVKRVTVAGSSAARFESSTANVNIGFVNTTNDPSGGTGKVPLVGASGDSFFIATGSSSITAQSVDSDGNLNLPLLTASLPLQLDSSKNIVSTAVNLSGSQVTSTLPVSKGGTNTTSFSAGSVIFAGTSGSSLSDNNTNFFWDNSTARLAVGNTSPQAPLHVNASGNLISRFESSGAGPVAIDFKDSGTSNTPKIGSNGDSLVIRTGAGPTTQVSVSSTGVVNLNQLTASLPVQTDGSKNLVSAAITLSGGQVTSTLGAANGGTGVANNAASTLTISGNFATTLTVSGTTGITLPTSGTVATLAGSENLTNKTLTSAAMSGTFTGAHTYSGVVTPSGGIHGQTAGSNASAGNIGEYVEKLQTSATDFPGLTTQWGDATFDGGGNFSLTAGDWDISVVFSFFKNGAVLAANNEICIGTVSGNDSTGKSTGVNHSYLTPPDGSTASATTSNIPSYRVNISGTTTYYLKIFGTYTVATPQYRCRISARRVQPGA